MDSEENQGKVNIFQVIQEVVNMTNNDNNICSLNVFG